MRSRRFNTVILLGLLAANLLLWAPNTLAFRKSAFNELGLLAALRHELVEGYVTEPDTDAMIKSAVQGMIDSLGDPYTNYLTDEDLKQFDKHVRGSFSGIGAEVITDPDLRRVKIVSPLEESPAWKAGIMAGDIILTIDGTDTEGMKISEAVERLTGPEGTNVTVRVRHESGDEATITITRAVINISTVKGLRRGDGQHWDWLIDPKLGIGYVRLTQFSERTAAELRTAVNAMKAQNLRGLIIDVRFNPGGLLESAVEISDMFLPAGKTIVSVRGRRVPEQVERSTDEGTLFDGPLVILANGSSASASEILAGALKDNDRARFIGERTFGKGSVQQLHLLEEGGALKITNAYYYIPSGQKIHRVKDHETWGVDPQAGFYVAMSPQQTMDMIKARRESDVLRNQADASSAVPITAELLRDQLHDTQLAAALTAMAGKITNGDWPQVGTDGGPEVRLHARRDNLARQRELINERLGEIDEELQKIDDQLSGKTPIVEKAEGHVEASRDLEAVGATE